jgi:hypothetical protein
MPKNVIMLSDGTGQVGGMNFDENRTNIYKMYRACRVATDSHVRFAAHNGLKSDIAPCPKCANSDQRTTANSVYSITSSARNNIP